MAQAELIQDQSRFLYNPESHEPIRFTDQEAQNAHSSIIRGVVAERPFIQSLGKGKRMAGFMLKGAEIWRGSPQTDYQVRVFGRSWSRIIRDGVKEGSHVVLTGRIGQFAEKDERGNFVTGNYFIVATNTWPDIA